MNKKDIDVVKGLLNLPLIINLGQGKFLKYIKVPQNRFLLVEQNLESEENMMTQLIFTDWDETVKNPSMNPAKGKFALNLKWKNIILEPSLIKASSFSRVVEAFKHVKLEAMDSDSVNRAFSR
jgi:hypothetical protein